MLQHAEAETPVHPLGTALEEVQIGTKQERITNERDLVPVLERLFLEVDALVATPDHRVFNILHIRPLLITSLRHRRPLLGYSASMVKAGSYAAIFTTPAQIAHQTTALMRNWNAGRKLPSPQYPEQFMVAFNVEVARSHGLPTFSTSDIRDALANLDMK